MILLGKLTNPDNLIVFDEIARFGWGATYIMLSTYTHTQMKNKNSIKLFAFWGFLRESCVFQLQKTEFLTLNHITNCMQKFIFPTILNLNVTFGVYVR